MKVIGYSDIGLVRKENQDSFWFKELNDHQCIAVVCDGMGGARGGQNASVLAVGAVKSAVENFKPNENIKKAFARIVEKSNRCVYEEAASNQELSGMGTTMVLVFIKNDVAYFANVGDSRAYHITNGSITQVTKDHSAVQELVDSGHLSERQAKQHPNKNIITRAIGIESDLEFDYFESTVSSGDIILLCSDGLSNLVDESEIQFEASSGGDFDDLAIRLTKLANIRGGTDNITVTAIQI